MALKLLIIGSGAYGPYGPETIDNLEAYYSGALFECVLLLQEHVNIKYGRGACLT